MSGHQTALHLPPRARATDPETSHLAASHMIRTGRIKAQQERVYQAVKSSPGRTALELDRQFGTDRVFGRRLSELERMGLVRKDTPRRCEVGGRLACVWVAV